VTRFNSATPANTPTQSREEGASDAHVANDLEETEPENNSDSSLQAHITAREHRFKLCLLPDRCHASDEVS
jgi:hypothetical protein